MRWWLKLPDRLSFSALPLMLRRGHSLCPFSFRLFFVLRPDLSSKLSFNRSQGLQRKARVRARSKGEKAVLIPASSLLFSTPPLQIIVPSCFPLCDHLASPFAAYLASLLMEGSETTSTAVKRRAWNENRE